MSDEPFPDELESAPEQPAAPPPTAPKPKREGNYKNANYKLVELNDEQKTFIAAHWANPEWDLKRITQHVFSDPTLDGHHTEGKSVRAYIATLGTTEAPAKPRTTAVPKKGPYTLTDAQKTNITALLNQDEAPPLKEIFKMVFPEMRDFSYLCPEYQAVARFIKITNEEAIDIWDEPVDERRYKPPGSWAILLGIVNKCVGNPRDINRALYDPSKMKASEERNIKALFSYMKNNTFVFKASEYQKKADRDLFISTFIGNVHDKAADLVPEEVDSYIELAAEVIQSAQINREIQSQQVHITSALDGDDDDNGTRAKLSMTLVESMNSLRDKLKETKAHILRLRTSVSGSRSKRIEDKTTKNDNVGNWLNQWVEEQTRRDLIELGKKEHLEDAAEYGRIKNMDDSWALIAGMTEEEARAAL